MNTSRLACAVCLVAVCWIPAGCEDGPDPVGADIGGSWTGRYERPGYSEPLTATVDQHGSNITITTSKTGVGHLLLGTISSEARIDVIDQYDGEEWTSYGPVTETSLRIRDYLFDPELGGDSPEQDIYLSR
jgi:hypothetical protein